MYFTNRNIILLAALAAVGCSSTELRDAQTGSSLANAGDVYTLVNLHPDETNARLYTVNYQMPGLIPVCSKINITDAGRKAVKFQVVDSGRAYEYILHRSLPESFEEHLGQIFGETCPSGNIEQMSALDQEGIQAGRAKIGMSKAAVLIAMGPPPSHANPSLESNEWMYWENRWGKLRVDFQDGKVSQVVQ